MGSGGWQGRAWLKVTEGMGLNGVLFLALSLPLLPGPDCVKPCLPLSQANSKGIKMDQKP